MKAELQRLRRGVTPAMRREIFDETGIAWCYYCGYPGYEVDHVVPVSRGGGLDSENLVPVCSECNREKSDLTVDEWAGARRDRGKPWPIPSLDARIATLHRRGEPWPWLPALHLDSAAMYVWIGQQPGGHAALRRCLVRARDIDCGAP